MPPHPASPGDRRPGGGHRRHVAAITQAAEAGYTHVWVHQIGPDQAGFFAFYASEVLPKLRLC
jgi:hypothetical protein